VMGEESHNWGGGASVLPGLGYAFRQVCPKVQPPVERLLIYLVIGLSQTIVVISAHLCQ
jgi:hypothetical protein